MVGRISAIGALAGLIRKHRTGVGARIHVSQAEAAINQLDTIYVTQAAEVSGVGHVLEDGAVHLVLACAGDDEWCVVSLRSEADRRAVASVVDGDFATWARLTRPRRSPKSCKARACPRVR